MQRRTSPLIKSFTVIDKEQTFDTDVRSVQYDKDRKLWKKNKERNIYKSEPL